MIIKADVTTCLRLSSPVRRSTVAGIIYSKAKAMRKRAGFGLGCINDVPAEQSSAPSASSAVFLERRCRSTAEDAEDAEDSAVLNH
jgi:hypothetical protein